MKVVIQRVQAARVEVNHQIVGQIGPGLLLYWGLEKGDSLAELEKIGSKILSLRIFADEAGKMNLSLQDDQASPTPLGLLLVSQFTLAADLSRGRRPGFDNAMPVEEARRFWPVVVEWFSQRHQPFAQGEFQADMQVHSINDGPATFLI